MEFKPVNRYIHINLRPHNAPERASGIVLPQDYTPAQERHVMATVISCASDVRFAESMTGGTQILIDQSMVEEITINKEKITVVLDNYVIGVLK